MRRVLMVCMYHRCCRVLVDAWIACFDVMQ